MTMMTPAKEGEVKRGGGAAVMRAGVVRAPGRVEVVSAAVPEPGPGQIRMRLEGCGVCASNVPPFEGREWFKYPMPTGALGHEGWGVVDAVGAGVRGFEVGERVAALSQHAYAEFDVADAASAVKLPAELNGRPFPGEPLGCAINIFRRSGVQAGDVVGIVGIGFLGALLTRLAANAGAVVVAISRRATGLVTARRFGAEHVVAMENHEDVLRGMHGIMGNRLCDVVIEATGKEGALNLAGELTKERGRLVVAGYHQDGLRRVNMQLWNWRGLDVINAHERDPAVYLEGMNAAVKAAAGGQLEPWELFTDRMGLERLGEALRLTRDRPDGFMKALIEF